MINKTILTKPLFIVCILSLMFFVIGCDNVKRILQPEPEPEVTAVPDPEPEPPEPEVTAVPDPEPEPPEPEVTAVPDPDWILPPEEPPPVNEISKGDKVTVINTLDIGLSMNDDDGKRIGGMFDGETGTVIADVKKAPDQNGNILEWVKIEWDAPVKNPKSGCGVDAVVCIGWSAIALADGTKLLKRLD